MTHILIVGKHDETYFWYEDVLKNGGLDIENVVVNSEDTLIEAAEKYRPQLILLDVLLPFTQQTGFIEKLYPIPVIMISDSMDIEMVVNYMKEGAADCVVKEDSHRLVRAVKEAVTYDHDLMKFKSGIDINEINRLLYTMIDGLPVAAFIKSSSGRLIWANRQALCLAQQNVSWSKENSMAALKKLAESNTDFPVELKEGVDFKVKEEKIITPEGLVKYLLSTMLPLRDRQDDIIGYSEILQDITERKRIENDLRSNMDRIKLVLDSSDVGVFDLDLAHDTVWRTLKHDQIYGFDSLQSQWKMDDFYKFVIPEDSEAVTSYMKNAIKEGFYHFECRIKRLDSKERWISCQGRVYHNEVGNPIRMIGTLMDITEKKRVELSLQKRVAELEMVNRISSLMYKGRNIQELLQVLMDETLAAISVMDGCILLYEPEQKMLEPVVTRGWFDKIKGHEFDEGECISGYVFMNDMQYITENIRKDPLLSRKIKKHIPPNQMGAYLPIHDSEGKLGVIIVACTLPRKISEDELRLLAIISRLAGSSATKVRLYEEIHYSYEELQKEVIRRKITQNLYAAEKEILSTTLMSIAEGMVTTDQDGLIILFNHAAEEILGYKAEEVLEKPVNTVLRILDTDTNQVADNPIEMLQLMDQRQIKDNMSYRSPTVLTKTGGKVLLGGSIASVKSDDDRSIGHVIVFQNVTEKQLLEAQNILSTKMEAIGQLAAGIAHEINTPVQYIGDNLSYIQRVLSKYTDMMEIYQETFLQHVDRAVTQKDIEALEAVRSKYRINRYKKEVPLSIAEAMEGVQRVQKIVTAVREFSHPSQKEMQMADINHGIETTVTISRNEWKYHAEMELSLDSDLPPVICQIDEINQVVLNMIVNAAQSIEERLGEHHDHKGKITIATRKDDDDDHVIITIQDTGTGIPEGIRERIFDPFFTTKGVGKGTGQGLSMAYNIIVKKHGGSIFVDSEVGMGTTFSIELPIKNKGS